MNYDARPGLKGKKLLGPSEGVFVRVMRKDLAESDALGGQSMGRHTSSGASGAPAPLHGRCGTHPVCSQLQAATHTTALHREI